MLEYGFEDGKVTISNLSVTYVQDADCCQEQDDVQALKLESEDGGGGPFVRLSLPDGGFFSISDIHDLEPIFEDFYSKLNYKEEKNTIKYRSDEQSCYNCVHYNPAGTCKFIDAMPNKIENCFTHIKTIL